MLSVKEVTKNKPKSEGYYRGEMEKTKNKCKQGIA